MLSSDPATIAIALVAAHYLADYPLQGDFLSRAKNKTTPVPGVPWQQAMLAHVFIHGAAVALITGLWWLLFAEMIIHWVMDEAKCLGQISFNTDQAVHLIFKAGWFCVWYGSVAL